MSGSMGNMVGMGSNGMGLGGGTAQLPSGNMGLLQMIMAAHQAQQQSQAPHGPMAGQLQSPMAQQPGGGPMSQAPQMPGMQPGGSPGQPPMGANPSAAVASSPQAAGIMQSLGGPQGVMSMINALKQGQNGIQPPGGAPGAQPGLGQMAQQAAANTGGAGSMLPAWLQSMLGSGQYGATGAGMTPAVGMGGMMGGGV